jgi:hypothetical protein
MTTTTTKKTRWGRNQRYQFQKQEGRVLQEQEREHLSEQERLAYEVFAELYRRKAHNPFLFEAYTKAKDETARALKEFEANQARIKELQKQYSKILGYVKGE